MQVSFPGLGWSLFVNDTLFSIGSFQIKWYGFLIGMGFLLAFIYGMWLCKKIQVDRSKIIGIAVISLLVGIVCARLYYCIFYRDANGHNPYFENPMLFFNIRDGGLGIYGGLIGGLAMGVILCKIQKVKIPATFDMAVLGFLIGQAIGRWGNFCNQEAFGSVTDLPWGMSSANTGFLPVHPCFLYESLWCAIGFVLLHFFTLYLRQYDGQTFLLYVIWYGTGRFFIEWLRTDSLYTVGFPIKISQLVALVSIAAAVALLIIAAVKHYRKLTGCGSRISMAQNGITWEMLNAKPAKEEKENNDKKVKENKDNKNKEESRDEKDNNDNSDNKDKQ